MKEFKVIVKISEETIQNLLDNKDYYGDNIEEKLVTKATDIAVASLARDFEKEYTNSSSYGSFDKVANEKLEEIITEKLDDLFQKHIDKNLASHWSTDKVGNWIEGKVKTHVEKKLTEHSEKIIQNLMVVNTDQQPDWH